MSKSAIPESVDWPEFISSHDMYFNFLTPSWHEAPHFGNAILGSMLYVNEENICIEIFRADVFDHRDESYGWTAYSRPRFRIGKFILETAGTPVSCELRKGLWNAELTGTINTDKGKLEIRHLIHSEDMAIVTEITPAEGEGMPVWNWEPFEAKTTRGGYPTDQESLETFAKRYGEHYLETLNLQKDNPAGRLETEGNISAWIQDLMAGGQYATAWTESETDGTQTSLITIANTFPEATAAVDTVIDIKAFMEKDKAEWIEEHRRWWHDYYPRSYLSIPDKELESLYWQTIYRYGCCSREGRYYIDTSGPWFQGAQWPYSTNDWNTQSAHWGIYAANRLDQGAEMLNRLHKGRENLIEAVFPEEWRDDSAYLHLSVNADMAGTRISDMRYYHLLGCLPWLLHNAWWQYRFSMDDDMLRDKIFPLLRRGMNLYFHISYADENGKINLKPTYSPETGIYKNANFDLSLFKWGCHILLESCEKLGIEDPLIPKWREVTEKLIDFPQDEKGFMLGSEQTAWPDHRHLSHLLMIYPLYLVNIDQPENRDVIRRSYDLAHKGVGSEEGGIEELKAMVETHAAPIGAAIGDGENALEGLKKMQSELHPNGLWGCSGNPCIESTFGLASIIQDMLIQSWSDPAETEAGPIRIFPALPSSWENVEFQDLLTEGAFLVSAKLEEGITQFIRIRSLAGEPCRIKTDMKNPEVHGDRDYSISKIRPGIFEINLKKGEVVILQNNK